MYLRSQEIRVSFEVSFLLTVDNLFSNIYAFCLYVKEYCLNLFETFCLKNQ